MVKKLTSNPEVMSVASGLDANAALIHETAKVKGFWPEKYTDHILTDTEDYYVVTEEAIGVKLALVHSEVTEVLEAVRKSQGKTAIVEEMADILIRTLDLYAALRNTGQVEDSLDEVFEAKMLKNAGRPVLHGNRF